MSISEQPVRYPRWATDGGALVVEPSEGAKDAGVVEDQIADPGAYNWLENTTYNWVRHLDERSLGPELFSAAPTWVEPTLKYTGAANTATLPLTPGVVWLAGRRLNLSAAYLASIGEDEHTFTIPSRTYLAINEARELEFHETAIGAAAPTPTAGYTLVLAVEVTVANSPFVDHLLPIFPPSPSLAQFGDGSDGDVNQSSGTLTLTRDMYWSNATFRGTVIVQPNGCRIFVRNRLLLGDTAKIIAKGGDASGATPGAAPFTARSLRSGTAGGAGGAAGDAGDAGDSSSRGLGGYGGDGGSGDTGGNLGASGGDVTAPTAAEGAASIRHAPGWLGYVQGSSGTFAVAGGSGGGGGGGGGATVGGGGGAGGGVISIAAAAIIAGAGTTIDARGGNGASTGGSGAGSGGGGGGGLVLIASLYRDIDGTVTVEGGDGGLSVVGSGGESGSDGAAGLVVYYDLA